MRLARPVAAAVALSFAALSSCNTDKPLAPQFRAISGAMMNVTLPAVRISEFHYDNVSTDVGEAVEVSFPTDSSLVGWQIVLYNGSNGAVYNTTSLTAGVVTACGSGRKVVVVSIAGIQNGSPDGIVLSRTDLGVSVVRDALSYLGSFTAVGGVANGVVLPDIGVAEGGSTPVGFSLQRDGLGVWAAPKQNTFGICNDTETPQATVADVTLAPETANVEIGSTQAFTAAAFDADNNPAATTFTWSSTDGAVASVSNSGIATGLTAGSTLIIAAAPNGVADTSSLTVTTPAPLADLVISQVYGGGGNSGAVYTNDFIEIFNRSDAVVPLSGWSVQRTSTAGTAWNMTTLTGSIQPHSYYLIQEAAGNGGTTPLPTPDAIGTANLGASDGKVVLARTNVEFAVACPTAASIADRLGYGPDGSANGCGSAWGRTSGLGNTTAALRLDAGCIKTGNSGTDFFVEAPAPRNSATAAHTCTASAATIVINEIMADPLLAAGGSSWGEWFEVKNTGAAPVDLLGWTIASQGQPSHVIASSVIVAPGGYAVLGRGSDPDLNGGITLDYNYFSGGSSTIFIDQTDFLSLHDASGGLVDIVRWTNGTTFVKGSTRGVSDASLDNFDAAGPNWGYSTTTFGDGDFGTPGADNGTLATVPPVIPNTISITGRRTTDPALPVGFEDQLFGAEINAFGDTISKTMTWTALTPAVATIDALGVMHALTAGSATFRAESPDHTTGTITLQAIVAVASSTALYGHNTEFGEPADADDSDDFIIRRPQYTTSYNRNKNTPNWVSYELDVTHFGTQVDRCDCFTHDPELPASYTHISTSDYTGAGTFAGYGIDRGHLARSADRTSGALDNATTYYFSNIIPQAGDLNQHPWAEMETFLGNLARSSGKEVYIIAGPAGDKGTVKGEGKLVIPTQVWKVAVIMPHDQGLSDIHNYTDLEVIAIIAPNDPGVDNVEWTTWKTTVDAVEALSGYDLLALLPDNIENAIESNTKPPIAVVDGPYTSLEGSSVSISGAGSFDPNGSVVSYAWTFGDGGSSTAASASHTYAQDGTYTVTLTVTDNDGLTDVVTTSAIVANVAPSVSALAGATLLPGETWSASGTFSDPGADVCTATVDYGDGGGAQALALGAGTFTLSHVYTAAGTNTVTVVVSDDDATTTRTATVVVLTQAAAIQDIMTAVDQLLAGGSINSGNANSLKAKLDAALKKVQQGEHAVAINQLNALLNEIDAMLRSGRLSPSDAASLSAAARRVIQSLS